MYEQTVRCIRDVSGRFTNETRDTKGLGLALARRWNKRLSDSDNSKTGERIRKVRKGALRKSL